MAINKKELVGTVAEKLGSTKKDAALALEAVVESIKGHLTEGQDVQLVGFANFTQKVVPAHSMVLGLTGETIEVPERTQYKAKMSKTLAK